MSEILEGIRVLDLTLALSGPYASQLLADMGAEVIRIETPSGEFDRAIGEQFPGGSDGFCFMTRARNKKAITLNLGTSEGQKVFQELVKRSDIIVENYAVPAKKALGLVYSDLSKVNPTIILVSISAYGLGGPYANIPGNDNIANAAAGVMSLTGFPNNPPTRPGVAWVDYSTGIHAALGAMFALYYREKTGQGQLVDTSLLHSAINLMVLQGAPAEYTVLNIIRGQLGNSSFNSFGDTFMTKDGWVAISCMGNRMWKRFTEVMGRKDLMDMPCFSSDRLRASNRLLLYPIVSNWLASKTRREVVQLLNSVAVTCAEVNSVVEAIHHPQVKARRIIEYPEYPGKGPLPTNSPAITLSKSPAHVKNWLSPNLGEHNEEIYSSLLGFSADKINQLKVNGVI